MVVEPVLNHLFFLFQHELAFREGFCFEDRIRHPQIAVAD